MVKECTRLENELKKFEDQKRIDMKKHLDEVTRSTVVFFCQTKLKMAQQALDQRFEKSSWDIEGWKVRLEELGGKRFSIIARMQVKEVV
ncbi:hypothetical protein Hanom_Chr12g01126881 [Helianthus anomalus]